MMVTVNGEERQVPAGTTVDQLLRTLSVNPLLVAVEVNVTVLRREQYPATTLADGDTVEIVQMVGGGA